MRKINPLLVFGGLSASLFVFRVTELFLINDSGVVKPWWIILPVYLILAATALFSLVAISKDRDDHGFSLNLRHEAALLILSVLLFCEGLSNLLISVEMSTVTFGSVSVCNTLILFAATFVLRRMKLNRIAAITAFVAFIEMIIYLVCVLIEIFTANGTSLSFNLNLLSLISFTAQLFFFKALAREYMRISTDNSKVSLKRSACILICILPAEIIGQTLTHTGLLSDFPAPPFRSSFVEILLSACLLVLAGCVLVAKEKNKEEPSQEVIEE